MFPSINYYICNGYSIVYRLLHHCKGIAQGQGVNESDAVVAKFSDTTVLHKPWV